LAKCRVNSLNFRPLLIALKQQSTKKSSVGEFTYTLSEKNKNKTKNRLFTMLHSAESNLIMEFLHDYKLIFKTALAHASEDPGVLFAVKNRGSEIL
jgi:hypothetical protein